MMKIKAIGVCVMLLLSGCATSGNKEGAALQSPKSPPEQKKFEAWTGTWSYEGEVTDSPLGPGGKSTGKAVGRPILNGFFFEWRYEEKDYQAVEIDWYDSAAKTYRVQHFSSGGGVSSGLAMWNGDTWTGMKTRVHNGIEYRQRGRMILAADGKSITDSAEISPDGKTWKLVSDCRYTKISDQPDAQPDLQAPQPQPQMKALEAFMGTWRCEAEEQATPLGPAGKHSWVGTGRWILNGFFSEIRTETNRNEHWLEFDWCDPIAKCVQWREFDDNGQTWSGTMVLEGNHWTGASVTTINGADMSFRNHGVISDDKKTSTAEAEYSTDRKTWKPLGKAKAAKIAEP